MIFFFQQKTKKNYQKNWSHPHYKWGKKSFFFMSGIKNGRISTIWKTFKKCLFLLNFLLNPSLLSQKITKKKWKKICLFWPYSCLFLIWLKISHFQPKNGPHPHYNDVRSIFFFCFFLEKKKNNLGPPLVALECHKNICNHFPDKLQKSGLIPYKLKIMLAKHR